MPRVAKRIGVLVAALCSGLLSPVAAQEDRRVFAGAIVGVAALSADAASVHSPEETAASLYKPENGVAADVFAGIHLAQYFSVQADYMGNRNDLALVSSFAAPDRGRFYEQHRQSAQHALVVSGLIYFRRVRSPIRPYLATGVSWFRFTSRAIGSPVANGLEAPAGAIVSTRLGLRSAVGIDIAVSRAVSVRYSFSETISSNPISPHLSPPGMSGLANYQNLVGVVGRF